VFRDLVIPQGQRQCFRRGRPVTWLLSAFSDGPAAGTTGWALTLVLPKSSAPTVPTNNATPAIATDA
jgi:hypothetical protein